VRCQRLSIGNRATNVMINSTVTRRTFVGGLAAAASNIWTGQCVAQESVAGLRKDVRSAAGQRDLGSYAVAVKLLQALDPNHPLNWDNIAQIHFDHCPHSNWWFLPWHRAYLYYFELACRFITQDAVFCVPYWDWSQDSRLPGPFWGRGNELFDDTRTITGDDFVDTEEGEYLGQRAINNILSGTWVDCYSGATAGDDQRDPTPGASLLESAHNRVHSKISGDMDSFVSPRDPIFWLHHANIDRLWASWMQQNREQMPDSNIWAGHMLQMFYDAQAARPVAVLTRDTANAVKYGAVYDKYERPTAARPAASVGSAQGVWRHSNATIVLNEARGPATGSNVDVGFSTLRLSAGMRGIVSSVFAASAVGDLEQPSNALSQTVVTGSQVVPGVHLRLQGVRRQAATNIALRVFVNNQKADTATSISDPTYVGTVSFFGDDHQHGAGGGATFILPVWDALSRLYAAGALTELATIDVTIVVVRSENAVPGASVGVTVDKIALIGPKQ
jgi:tyrosinase